MNRERFVPSMEQRWQALAVADRQSIESCGQTPMLAASLEGGSRHGALAVGTIDGGLGQPGLRQEDHVSFRVHDQELTGSSREGQSWEFSRARTRDIEARCRNRGVTDWCVVDGGGPRLGWEPRGHHGMGWTGIRSTAIGCRDMTEEQL
jgi:hypothetical protein